MKVHFAILMAALATVIIMQGAISYAQTIDSAGNATDEIITGFGNETAP